MRTGPRKRPTLCGTPAISSASVSASAVMWNSASRRPGLGDLLHVRAARGDRDRERPDLRDREVVVDRPLDDHGLHGQQPGDQPPGRLRVVMGELDQGAAEPGVLALAAAGGVRPSRARRAETISRRSGGAAAGAIAAPARSTPRRQQLGDALVGRRSVGLGGPATASSGGEDLAAGARDGPSAARFGDAVCGRSRRADAAASRSATTRPVSSSARGRRPPPPRPAPGRGAGARARRRGPRRGGRARPRGRAARPRARPRRAGSGAPRARPGRPRGPRARR